MKLQLSDQVSFRGKNCYARMYMMRGCLLLMIGQVENIILISFFCVKFPACCQNSLKLEV